MLLNVQGLTSRRTNKLQTPELECVFNNHDIVFFTETWTNDFSNLQVNNFEYFVLNRSENKQSSRRSSGGVIVYIRNQYVTNDTLVFKSSDDILCIKISGCKFGLNNDVYFCLCYVVPENSSRQSMIETHTFDRLFTFITELNAKNENAFNFVLCGDMNAHTSDSCDFVSNDSSFHIIDNLPADYCTDVFFKKKFQR